MRGSAVRIVHIIDSLDMGGAQKLEVTFAIEAARRDLGFTVVSLAPDDDEPIVADLRRHGADVICLDRPGGTPLRQLLLLLALIRLLGRLRPTAVQTHLTYANLLGTFAARLRRVPVVATLHNTDTDTAHHRPALLRMEGWALRRLAARVIAVGPAVAAGQRPRLGSVQPVVVRNAVSAPAVLDAADRASLRAELLGPDGKVLVVSVGRLTAQKAYADLIDAFAQVVAARPATVLVIAGDGELRSTLDAQLEAAGLRGNVQLLGARNDVGRLLAAADVFASSSRWEGLPLAVLEAMGAGLPVVTTSVGDIPTIVTPETGLTVPANRPDELAAAIATLVDDSAQRRQLGAAAGQRIAEHYSAGRWVDQLLELYRQVGGEDVPQVAVLSHGYFPRVGGAERQLGALAPLLVRSGIGVRILTRRFGGAARRELIEGVDVHRLPAPGPVPLASLTYTVTALLALLRMRPGLIHAHEFISPATTALLAKRLLRVPIVVTAHRSGPLGDVEQLRQRRSGPKRLAALRRHVDLFVAISGDIEEELEGMGVASHRRMRLPNGVDTEHFRPADEAEQQTLRAALDLPPGPIAVYAGRLAPEKRVGHLLAIWAAVRDAVPNATLLILGTGEQEADLRAAAGEGVIFGGATDDVAPWYRAADVFVLPSVAEGLSVAMLEALAAGLAVIVTDVGGAADVITSGEDGVIVPPDDPRGLQDALVAVLGDASLRSRLGERGRARVEHAYALPVIADRLRDTYQALMRGAST
jgi:glycosyltransferase involved in cell wall biosynthesis